MVTLLRESRLLPLFDDSPVANYWLGFLFATASIVRLKSDKKANKKEQYLNLRVPMYMFWFLIKFKMFLNARNKIWYHQSVNLLLLRFQDRLLGELERYGLRERLGQRNKAYLKTGNPYFWFGYIDAVIMPHMQEEILDSIYIGGKPEIIKQLTACLKPFGLPEYQMLGENYLLFKEQELEQLFMFLYEKRPAPFHMAQFVTQYAPSAQTFLLTQEMLAVAQNESPWDLLSQQVIDQ